MGTIELIDLGTIKYRCIISTTPCLLAPGVGRGGDIITHHSGLAAYGEVRGGDSEPGTPSLLNRFAWNAPQDTELNGAYPPLKILSSEL